MITPIILAICAMFLFVFGAYRMYHDQSYGFTLIYVGCILLLLLIGVEHPEFFQET